MKALLCTLFIMSPLAFAQIAGPTAAGDELCDMTFTMKVSFGGQPQADSNIKYLGFTSDDATFIHKQAQSIVDVASKNQDKARPPAYSVEFGESGCGANGSVMVDGVSLGGMSQIMKEASKVGLQLIKRGDDAGAKGNRKGWGNRKT